MFDALGAFFEGLWNVFKGIVQGVWTILVKGWTWAVGLIVIIIGCVTTIVNALYQLLADTADAFLSFTAPQSTLSTTAGTMLSTANYFFPVQEAFALLVALSVLWVIMLSYRTIKSWIPTLS